MGACGAVGDEMGSDKHEIARSGSGDAGSDSARSLTLLIDSSFLRLCMSAEAAIC